MNPPRNGDRTGKFAIRQTLPGAMPRDFSPVQAWKELPSKSKAAAASKSASHKSSPSCG
jgi:hypothetical protein